MQILRQLADTHNPKDAANLVDTLKKEVRSLYNFLMAQEMTLVEQFEDVVKEVEQNYSQLCSTTLDLTRVFFQRMRDLANEWHEKSVELVMSAFEKFAKTEIDELDDVIREVLRAVARSMVGDLLVTNCLAAI